MSTVRGEWWIDDRGDSHFADIDTGDVGHEALAYCSALGLPLDDLSDYDGPEFEVGQQLTPELVRYLRDQGADKDAIAFFSQPHQDAREFMLLHRNWIRVKGDNFEVGKFNADALKRIRNFEGWDDDAEDSAGAVWIEERAAEPEWLAEEGRWSNQGWYGQVPIRALLGTATVAELRAEYGTRQNPRRRNPGRRARNAPAGRDERNALAAQVYAGLSDAQMDRVYAAQRRRSNPALGSYFVGADDVVDMVAHARPDTTHAEDQDRPPGYREKYIKRPHRRWWADGPIVRIDADKVLFMEGNIWRFPHAAGVAALMREGEEFEVPAARVYRVTAAHVRDTQRAADEDRLEYDYGMTRPWEKTDVGAYYAQLLDGNHRAAAAMSLGDSTIYAYVGADYMQNVRKKDLE